MKTKAADSNAIAGALRAEEARQQSLLKSDWLTLDSLLSHNLVYVHSPTVRDTKASLMAKLAGGELQYLQVNFEDLQAQAAGHCVVITGRFLAEISKQGHSKKVQSLFMTVWRLDDTDGAEPRWQLIAHQGTPLAI